MHTTQLATARHSAFAAATTLGALALPFLIAASLLVGVGCGPAQEASEVEDLAQQAGALAEEEASDSGRVSTNGISMNGISMNGVSINGISMNGISMNGLTPEAINTTQFAAWFRTDPAANDVLMRYIARCGLEENERITFKDRTTGQKYVWDGLLGLTPRWAKGKAINEEEQQLDHRVPRGARQQVRAAHQHLRAGR